jgi:chromosome segregation ATPase
VDFDSELESLRDYKRTLEGEIAELEEQLAEKSANTKNIRRDLEQWKESVETGEVPEDEDDTSTASGPIPAVDVNSETGRPPRGARGEQIEKAIEVISRRRDEFKAAELFDLIREHDPGFGENQRDYMYSKLNDLQDDGELEKVKRGTWTLAD